MIEEEKREWVCTCERDADGVFQKLSPDCPLHTENSKSLFDDCELGPQMIYWYLIVPSLFFAFLLGGIFFDTLGRRLFVWIIKRCPDPLAREAMREMLDQAAGRVYIVAYYHRLRDLSAASILLTTLRAAHDEGERGAAEQLAENGTKRAQRRGAVSSSLRWRGERRVRSCEST